VSISFSAKASVFFQSIFFIFSNFIDLFKYDETFFTSSTFCFDSAIIDNLDDSKKSLTVDKLGSHFIYDFLNSSNLP